MTDRIHSGIRQRRRCICRVRMGLGYNYLDFPRNCSLPHTKNTALRQSLSDSQSTKLIKILNFIVTYSQSQELNC